MKNEYDQYFPADMDCSESVKAEVYRKIQAFNLLSDELPVVIIHDIKKDSVIYMTPYGLSMLKTDLKTVQSLGNAYYKTYFDSEDAEYYLSMFHKFVENPSNFDSWFTYFQQVRTGVGEEFQWYLSASRVIIVDESANEAIYAMTIALRLNEYLPIAAKLQRLVNENKFIKENVHKFKALTKTEVKILEYIAKGHNSKEIAGLIHVTEDTYRTHRKHIKKKLDAVSDIDLLKYAQAFNL